MRSTFLLGNLPRRETLRELARRYPDLDLSAQECFMALLGTASGILEAAEEQMTRRGTSQGRMRVLLQLQRAPGQALSPKELAGRLAVTPATVTGLLDGLERAGQARRESRPGDRRSITVRLTPAGARFLDGIMPDRFRRIHRLMAGLSEPQRRSLVRLLDAVSEGMEGFRR